MAGEKVNPAQGINGPHLENYMSNKEAVMNSIREKLSFLEAALERITGTNMKAIILAPVPAPPDSNNFIAQMSYSNKELQFMNDRLDSICSEVKAIVGSI
jgi:hypothetical protein